MLKFKMLVALACEKENRRILYHSLLELFLAVSCLYITLIICVHGIKSLLYFI